MTLRRSLRALALAAVVGCTTGAANAATFVVTTTADTNDGACTVSLCSLRDAIIAANATSGANTITLPAGTYTLAIPGQNEDAAATGDLDVTGNVTINGAGALTTIIDGGALDRVLHVVNTGVATINNVTIRNGLAPGASDGGGIFVSGNGTLTLSGVTVSNNHTTTGIGGGMLNNGTTTIANSIFSGNGTGGGGGGGGINNQNAMTIDSTSITGNTTGSGGGNGAGINNSATMTLTNATVSGNSAGGGGNGGGIFNSSQLTVGATSIGNNSAGPAGGNGGGVYNSSTASFTNSTISTNATAGGGNGGGAYNSDTLTLVATPVVGNTASGDGGGIYDSGLLLTLTNVTVGNNAAGPAGNGGGLFSISAGIAVSGTTFSGNAAGGSGGAIYNNGIGGTLTNVTLSGNTAATATVFNFGLQLDFVDATIAGNTGGGIQTLGGSTTTLKNTIVSNNGVNCTGSVTNNGTNLQFPGTTCGASIPTADPLLQGLASNGGPTMTMALGAGSPAIDAGTTGCPPTPASDQRGVARPQGAACDIGAFEGQAAALPTLSIDNVSQNEGNVGTTPFVFTVTLSAASGSTVTVDFATANGSAAAPGDFAATSGTLTFAPGATSQTITVSVVGDTVPEPNETFVVNLSNAANATIAVAQGTGTIVNDDAVSPPPARGPTAAIPALQPWGQLVLFLLLLVLGVAAIARRQRR